MGGKKKQTIGYKYYLGLHMILCLGPIDRLLAMLADRKEAWSGDIGDDAFDVEAEELFGGEEKEGGISGEFEFQLGTNTQLVNSYLAAKLSPELIPAYRGVAGVMSLDEPPQYEAPAPKAKAPADLKNKYGLE